MSEANQANGAAGAEQQAGAAQFTVEKLYVKDVSFEAPNAPQVFQENAQPQLQMNLNQQVNRLNDNVFEVVLGVTMTCTVNDKNAYLVEVKQAGVFGLVGFDDQTLDMLLGTHCPNVLYPYARQVISDLIQAGGFPPFLLQPINFEALYAEGLRQRAAQQEGEKADLADEKAAGNA